MSWVVAELSSAVPWYKEEFSNPLQTCWKETGATDSSNMLEDIHLASSTESSTPTCLPKTNDGVTVRMPSQVVDPFPVPWWAPKSYMPFSSMVMP